MPEKWLITLDIETQTAFHTLGPGHTLPLIDRMLQVDPTGRPMIPGSSVRGRVRAHLERLLKASGRPVCTPPQPDKTCPHAPAIQTELKQLSPEYCLACRIFGSAWRDSKVSFSNFYLQDDLAAEQVTAERTAVSLNRRLGVAQAERLFTAQTTLPGKSLSFAGTIEGLLIPQELGWLLAALRLVTHLGGSKARGLGQVNLKIARLEQWAGRDQGWQEVNQQPLLEEVRRDAAL